MRHEFVGRHDRDCEFCGKPDRDPIHKNWLIQEAPTTLEASALAPSQTERQTDSLGRSTDLNIQPKETPSLTLEGLNAKVLLNGFVWHGYHPTLDAERLRVSLETYIDNRLAELGLRHEAKDVELREAAERLLASIKNVGVYHINPLRQHDYDFEQYKQVGVPLLDALRKALEGMEVDG